MLKQGDPSPHTLKIHHAHKTLPIATYSNSTSSALGRPVFSSITVVYLTRVPISGMTPPFVLQDPGKTNMSSSPESCSMKPNFSKILFTVPVLKSPDCCAPAPIKHPAAECA